MTTDAPQHLQWEGVDSPEPPPDPDGREWLSLTACAVCGSTAFTHVCEWNKLLLLKKAPDVHAVRYDYAVCHACGILFAARRPCGDRFRYLLRHFGEVTGSRAAPSEMKNYLLNPYPLTDEQKQHLERLAKAGVFVSDHLGLSSSQWVGGLLRDRFENSVHLDVIASLLAPRRARVLEIRSRAGTILDGLRRLFDAEVYAMPIWESQQVLLRAAYGIEASTAIDFDRFDIPFEGQFDLIICNHMITHVIRPADFLGVLRRRLKPGGHLYLHNEPDDAEFLRGRQSMIASLNPLHMQAFDQRSLMRALAASGFRTLFIKARGDMKHMCLAQLDPDVRLEPMGGPERDRRIAAYERARDRAVLLLAAEMQARVAGVWEATVERGVATGVAEFDEHGRLRLVAN